MFHLEPHRIILVSDHEMYREALKMLLNAANSEFRVEALAMNEPNCLALITENCPEILLLDANTMGKTIWKFLQDIHKVCPSIKIIVLANNKEKIYLENAKKNGASGYVLKSSPKEILVAAIKIVIRDGAFFDPGTTSNYRNESYEMIKEKYNLSNRELEIVILIKDGMTSKDVAAALGISHHTVEAHRKNVYNKLQINKITELLKILTLYED